MTVVDASVVISLTVMPLDFRNDKPLHVPYSEIKALINVFKM